MSKVADSIRRGLQEAVAYAEGTADESGYRVHVPEKVDTRVLRGGEGTSRLLSGTLCVDQARWVVSRTKR